MMNDIVIRGTMAWFFAQTAKVLVGILRYGIDDIPRMPWRLIWAGGMPSAHSALMSCVSCVIWHQHGAQSSLFALSMVLTCIVLYDRSRMYAIYSTFQRRYPAFKQKVQNDPLLKDLIGHRMSEIAVGVVIGILTGLVTAY